MDSCRARDAEDRPVLGLQVDEVGLRGVERLDVGEQRQPAGDRPGPAAGHRVRAHERPGLLVEPGVPVVGRRRRRSGCWRRSVSSGSGNRVGMVLARQVQRAAADGTARRGAPGGGAACGASPAGVDGRARRAGARGQRLGRLRDPGPPLGVGPPPGAVAPAAPWCAVGPRPRRCRRGLGRAAGSPLAGPGPPGPRLGLAGLRLGVAGTGAAACPARGRPDAARPGSPSAARDGAWRLRG